MLKRQQAHALGRPGRSRSALSRRGPEAKARTGNIREANVARLLEAAETVFAERGFAGATTAAIARLANLPKANLHYYFPTKDALYRAALENVLPLSLNDLDRFPPAPHPPHALADSIH